MASLKLDVNRPLVIGGLQEMQLNRVVSIQLVLCNVQCKPISFLRSIKFSRKFYTNWATNNIKDKSGLHSNAIQQHNFSLFIASNSS